MSSFDCAHLIPFPHTLIRFSVVGVIHRSYAGKPPPTASLIMDYLERAVLNEGKAVQGTAQGRQNRLLEALEMVYCGTGAGTGTGWDSSSNGPRTTAPDSTLYWVNRRAIHAIHARTRVSRATVLKPLSASATSVCVIPQKGEYFVPGHLRTIWRRLQVGGNITLNTYLITHTSK